MEEATLSFKFRAECSHIASSYCGHNWNFFSTPPKHQREPGCALRLLRPLDLANQKNTALNYCRFSVIRWRLRGANKLFPLNLEVPTLSRQPVVYIDVTLGDTWTCAPASPPVSSAARAKQTASLLRVIDSFPRGKQSVPQSVSCLLNDFRAPLGAHSGGRMQKLKAR